MSGKRSNIADIDIVAELSRDRSSSSLPFAALPETEPCVDSDEPSAISPENSEKQLILKIGMMVEKQATMVRAIPELHRIAEEARISASETGRKLVEVAATQAVIGNKLEVLQVQKHDCRFGLSVPQLMESRKKWDNAVAKATKIEDKLEHQTNTTNEIKSRTEKVEANGRNLLVGLLLASVGIIVSVILAAYNIGGDVQGLTRDLEAERDMRTEQLAGLKTRIERLPTKSDVPTRRDIGQLQEKVEQSGQNFEARCGRLEKHQKALLFRKVRDGSLPPEFLCPLE
jgi:hypothetical protein